jgi:hypothetical protein
MESIKILRDNERECNKHHFWNKPPIRCKNCGKLQEVIVLKNIVFCKIHYHQK